MSDNIVPAGQQLTISPPAELPANRPNLYDPLFADRIEGLVKPAGAANSNQPPIRQLLPADAGKGEQAEAWWYFVFAAAVLSRIFTSCNYLTDSASRVKNATIQQAPRLDDHRGAPNR